MGEEIPVSIKGEASDAPDPLTNVAMAIGDEEFAL
jgi:hypothetical protein